jgi:hypothetical protein
VPFLRFSRDKRGYEHFYLVEPTTRRGKSRNRILYWFRTPPGVKVGRLPFDDHVRRALEARYPDVAFDWQKLIDTPIPPPAPDVERWRERRRLERAAKQAAASDAAAERADAASEDEEALEPASPAPMATEVVATSAEAPPGRRRRRRSGRHGRTNVVAAPGESTGAGPDAALSERVGADPMAGDTPPAEAAERPKPDED